MTNGEGRVRNVDKPRYCLDAASGRVHQKRVTITMGLRVLHAAPQNGAFCVAALAACGLTLVGLFWKTFAWVAAALAALLILAVIVRSSGRKSGRPI